MSCRIFLALLLLSITLTGCKKPEEAKSDPKVVNGQGTKLPDETNAVKEVKLTIDTGDPKVTTVKVPFAEKMTVRDALKVAAGQGITAVYQGEDAGAMLQTLQGIGNQGGGKEAKNWIFYVNGKQATISSAVYSLQPGDAIIWRFEKYE
jgi:hypothetical protein